VKDTPVLSLALQKAFGCSTMAILNAGLGADIKVVTLNLTAKRKVKCLENPTTHSRDRCAQAKKPNNVMTNGYVYWSLQ